MKIWKQVLQKLLTLTSIFLVFLNCLTPLALAQELESTPNPQATSTPAPEESPEVTPSPTPSETPQPTPQVSPSPIESPTPTPTPSETQSPAPSDQPEVSNSNSSPVGQPNAPPTPTESGPTETPSPAVIVSPSPSLTPAPVKEIPQGHLSVVIEHESTQQDTKLDLSQNGQTSASLTTDKADYSPTDVAIISGSGLLTNTTYILTISSTDDPATSTSENVTTNDNGNFIYSYQLDGNYRPNYSVVLKDQAGTVVASTTFTDAPSGVTVTCGSVTIPCGGTNIPSNKAANGSQPTFTTLGNIVIAENVKGDFPSPQGVSPNAPVTLILTAPSGWTFKSGTGSTTTTGTDITIVSTSVTSTSPCATSCVTVSFRIAAAQGKNTMTISGIQVQALDKANVPGSGNILRTSANPGTAAITGVTNNSTNFGSLSQSAVADAANSTVTASPATVPADGSTTSTVTVALKDSANNAVSGKAVTLAKSSGPGTPIITTTQGTTDASGQALFTVKSSTVGTDEFQAKDTTDGNVVITQTASVNFASSIVTITSATGGTAVNADTNTTNGTANWTALTGPIIAEGLTGSITTGTIVMNTPSGFVFNTGQAVTVLVTRTTGSGADSKNINGVASGTSLAVTAQTSTQITFTVTSATNGVTNTLTWQNIQVRPTVGTPLANGNITNTGTSTGVSGGSTNYGTLTETSGSVNAANSTISPSSNSVTADGSHSSAITVTVKDAYSNPVSGKTVTLSGNNGTHSTVSSASGPSASDGTVTFTVTDTTAESVTYTAIASGQTLTHTTSVTFIPGAVSASTSTASANPGAIPADNMTTSTITVTLKDAFNNTIPNTSVSLVQSQGSGATITGSPTTTNPSGQATFTVKSPNAGQAAFQATSVTTAIAQTASVNFTSIAQPEITSQISPTPNINGWNKGDVTVNWVITDPNSIVTSTTNCGTTSITGETAGTPVTCSVSTSVNTTISKTVTIKIDKTKPVINGSASPSPNVNGWNNVDVTVSFTCADAETVQSGIATNTLAGTTLNTDGTGQSFQNTGSCADNAGNIADSVIVSGINIDKSLPAIDPTSVIGTLGNNGWYITNVTVTFLATDNLSGFQNGLTFIDLASKSTVADGSSQVLSSDTISDLAGNSAIAFQTEPFNIDTTAPDAPSVTLLDPINLSNVTEQNVNLTGTGEAGAAFTYTISDAGNAHSVSGSGVVDGGINVGGIDVSALNDGELTASIILTDAAGNTGQAGTDTATKDTIVPLTPPAPTVAGNNIINNSEYNDIVVTGTAEAGSLVSVTLIDNSELGNRIDATQQLSGSETAYTIHIDGADAQAGDSSDGLQDGTINVTVTAQDAAGNVSNQQSTTVTQDTSAPSITIDPYNTDLTNADVTVNASTEEGSTLNSTAHTFSENGDFDFVATDEAGNITTEMVSITNIDKTAPIVVTQLGNDSTDVVLAAGSTTSLIVFSEALPVTSQTAVQNALTAGANKELNYSWDDSSFLTITATEETTFANDVVVKVSDVAGNSTELLIVDSALSSTQKAPDVDGAVTVDNTTPEVVITNPTQAVNLTISSGTINPTIDVSSFVTGGTGTLPKITIDSEKADIAIPASTVVTSADTTWNGVIAAPTVTTVTLPETTGETKTLSTAIEVGFTGAKLSFNKAVKLLLPGQAGKKAGYIRPGIAFTEITSTCAADNQATGDALAVDGDCKIDSGLDLVIWTKHFTKFASYTQTTNSSSSSSSSSSNGGGGGDGLGCAVHDCSGGNPAPRNKPVAEFAPGVLGASTKVAEGETLGESTPSSTAPEASSQPVQTAKSGSKLPMVVLVLVLASVLGFVIFKMFL